MHEFYKKMLDVTSYNFQIWNTYLSDFSIYFSVF